MDKCESDKGNKKSLQKDINTLRRPNFAIVSKPFLITCATKVSQLKVEKRINNKNLIFFSLLNTIGADRAYGYFFVNKKVEFFTDKRVFVS